MDPEELLHHLANHSQDLADPDTPCPETSMLDAFRNGRLEPPVRDKVESHLAACASCVDRLVTLDMNMPRMSRQTRARVLDATRPTQDRSWAWNPRWIAAAVPVAMAAVAALTLWPHTEPAGLPAYQFQVSGQRMAVRGHSGQAFPESRPGQAPVPGPTRGMDSAAEEAPLFYPGSVLTLTASPDLAPPTDPPEVAIYLEDPTGATVRLELDPPPSLDPETGTIVARIPLRTHLGARFGLYRLKALVLPTGTHPPETLTTNREQLPHGARIFSTPFRYQPLTP